MRTIAICLAAFLLLTRTLPLQAAQESSSESKHVMLYTTGTVVSTYSTMINNAPQSLAKGIVGNSTILKGEIGELIAQDAIARQLAQNGNWIQIRSGSYTFEGNRKGIDLAALKLDERTYYPVGLRCDEIKYGTSRLGYTKDSQQASLRWNAPRLQGLGDRYLRVASSAVECTSMPIGIPDNQKLRIRLPNNKDVYFWRKNSLDKWKVNCTEKELISVRKYARSYGSFFISAGKGAISYENNIDRVVEKNTKGTGYLLWQRDANKLGKYKDESKTVKYQYESELPVKKKVEIKTLRNETTREIQRVTTKYLKGKAPWLPQKIIDDTSRTFAKEIKRGQINQFNNNQLSFKNALGASGIAMGLDASLQLITNDFSITDIDYKEIGLTGIAAIGSSLVARAVQNALVNGLNCSSNATWSSFASDVSGGVVFSILYAAGAWALGYMDFETAKSFAIQGSLFSLGVSLLAKTLFVAFEIPEPITAGVVAGVVIIITIWKYLDDKNENKKYIIRLCEGLKENPMIWLNILENERARELIPYR